MLTNENIRGKIEKNTFAKLVNTRIIVKLGKRARKQTRGRPLQQTLSWKGVT